MKSAPSRRKIGLVARFLLALIGFYQRHISPRKGFRCAYAALHGGPGCSGFVRDALANHGARAAIALSKARFRDCKRASQILRAEKHPLEKSEPFDQAPNEAAPDKLKQSRSKSKGSWFDWCHCDPNWCSCANYAFDCGPGDVGCIDCTPCDCLPCL